MIISRKFYNKCGFTIIELLITIAIVSAISTMFVFTNFPKEGDFLAKEPKVSLTSSIRNSKKLANKYTSNMRIHFIDNLKPFDLKNYLLGKSSTTNLATIKNQGGPLEASIDQFLATVSADPTRAWTDSFNTKIPFFFVTDETDRIVLDDNEIVYAPIENVNTNAQIASAGTNVFDDLDPSTGKAKTGNKNSRNYITVYKNDLCDLAIFTANSYNQNSQPSLELKIDSLGEVL